MTARPARRSGTVVTVLLLVVAVLVGAAVARVDTWWPVLTATTTRGDVGDEVTAGPLRVRVDGVRTGTLLVDPYSELTTGGVWVGVDMAVSGTQADAGPGSLQLRDAGGIGYTATTRTSNPLVYTARAPDVPEAGTAVFEVPAQALDGDLVLRVLSEVDDADGERPQAIAEISLGRVTGPAQDDVLEPVEVALVPGGWGG
ncbi:hypothetical protein [Cellulosimicrobium arenosum]|uniref:Uncharacterized protein n=1 Tax=Cellulosimicrobium arenosum TaxID=2708133 RepID=A0A927IZP4_9MICO|nr:hypothetical protein [Cellulosimicrobium arenosum]MBD8078715.1 hypothetical protein [Cellulosimicrobium arenosum]